MKTSKYPIISQNNKKYSIKIKRHVNEYGSDSLECKLYKKIWFIRIPVYRESLFYRYNITLKAVAESVVYSYEYLKGYGRTIHSSLEDFKQWDGDMRKMKIKE